MTDTQQVSPGGAAFELVFEGPGVASEMDVRALAPALLSMANLLQELNRTLRPSDPDVAVRIQATESGSFEVLLNLAYHQVDGFLVGAGVTGALNLGGLVDQTGRLLDFVKRKFHHGVVSEEPAAGGNTTVTFGDNTTLNINQVILGAADSRRIQDNLTTAIAPVQQDGIDRMLIRQAGAIAAEVESGDTEAFRFSATPHNVISSSERDVALSIVRADFTGGKWRFHDGMARFWATIEDEAFKERIASGEKFGSRDILRCRIREVQTQDEQGNLHADIAVAEVLGLIPPPTQPQLFLMPKQDQAQNPPELPPG